MKYFEIQDSPELKYAPQLKDWYGKFDVRNICPLGFPKLPERELFFIEPSENTIFTDIILSPFLLISPMVREVTTFRTLKAPGWPPRLLFWPLKSTAP